MGERLLYQGRILSLLVADDRWEIVRHKDAVAVLAVDAGEVLLVRQYRVAIGAETLELPAGLIEPGEAPEEAARRELMEEAGYDAELTLLFGFYSSPGFTDEYIHLFKAERLTPARRPQDPGENVRAGWYDLEEIWQRFLRGELKTSSPTAAGLLWLRR